MHFDCGWDTYFDSSPEAGEYLASSWNIGSSVNRFIHFGVPDVSPPTTTIVSGPTGPTSDSTPTFGFSANELAKFECRFDGAAFAPCSGTSSHTPATPLTPDGPHTFDVRATDEYTNLGAADSQAFSIDTLAPDTQIDSAPSGTITTNSASISFSSPDTSATFECRLDSAPFAPCSSPRDLAGLSEGTHTVNVRARDGVGNIDASPASASFTVDLPEPPPPEPPPPGEPPPPADKDAPQTTIDSGPSKIKKGKNATFTFSSSEPNSTFECQLDGKGFAPCPSPTTLVKPKKGLHTFEVRAIDPSANKDGSPAKQDFTVKKKRRRR
jgi:hypothetical protein